MREDPRAEARSLEGWRERANHQTSSTNYAAGAVGSGSSIDGGGFVGYDVRANSYTFDYYDMTTTGQSDTWKGSQPRTTGQMKLLDTSVATYQSWDFINTWSIDNTGLINDGYPYLKNNQPYP